MTKFKESVKTFNQYVLAIAGIVGIFILLFMAVITFDEMARLWPFNSPEFTNGIIATEETAELTKDSLRKQIISFNSMSIIDSANQIFIIPVGHASLENDENYDTRLLNMHSKSNVSVNLNATFNNLVVYNNKTSTSEVIFKQRLSISDFFKYSFEKRKFIVITASLNDTNKDGVLNQLDFQKLFLYDLSSRSLYGMDTADNYTILNAYTPHRSNTLIVKFGVDRNHNNYFDHSLEPKTFSKVDINSMTLKEIIDTEKLDRLQKLLEGR